MVKIFFTYKGEVVTLPVNPARLEIGKEGSNTRTELVKLGEINILRKPRLADIPLEGILPARPDSSLLVDRSGYREPSYYISFFERIITDCSPVGLAVSDLDIGFEGAASLVSVESFSYYREGGDEDVYYSLKLCEYKTHQAHSMTVNTIVTDTGQVAAVKTVEREVTRAIPKTYTVKAGDRLWAICKKELGDGSRYPEIAKLNGIPDPNKIKVGQVLKLG